MMYRFAAFLISVFVIFSCSHVQHKDSAHDPKCSEDLTRLYFSDWNTCLKCSESIIDGNEKGGLRRQLASFVLGEYNFLRYNDSKAVENFLNALDGPDKTVARAAVTYLGKINLDLESIDSLVNKDTDRIDYSEVRLATDILRMKWALAADRKRVFSKIIPRITVPGAFKLKKSSDEGSIKEIFPDMNGTVDLKDHYSGLSGEEFDLISDFYLSGKNSFSILVQTEMKYEIYVDNLKLKNKSLFSLSEGNHRIAIRIRPEKETSTDIGIYFPFYNTDVSIVKNDADTGDISLVEQLEEVKTVFVKYLELLNEEDPSQDDYYGVYSSVMGSFSPPFIYNLAVRSLNERSIERGLNYLKMIVDKYGFLRPELDMKEWMLYTGREKELNELEKEYPVKKENIHSYLFELDRASFKKQYLSGLVMSDELIGKFPKNPASYYYMAAAYEDMGYYKRSLYTRLKLLKKLPYHLSNLSNIKNIALRLEKSKAEKKALNRMLIRFPNSLKLRKSLADNYFRTGHYENAESIYDWILSRTEDDLDSLIGKGDTAFVRGNKNTARKYYTKAFLLYPESSEASAKAAVFKEHDFSRYFDKYSKSDADVLKMTVNYKEVRDVPYTVVYDEGHYRVVNHNLIVAKFRMLIRINNSEGIKEFTDKEYSGTLIRAVIVRKGKIIKVQKKEKENVLELSDLQIGDYLDYTLITEHHNDYWLKGFNDLWVFGQHEVPYINSTVTLYIPQDTKLNYHISKGVEGPRIFEEKEGKVYVFSKKNTFLSSPEINSPHRYEIVPNLQFSILNSWNDFAKWQTESIREGLTITRDIEEKTFSLIEEKDSSITRIRKLRDFVARKVRYRKIDPGELRVLPESAQKTLKRMSGDCKDKALLLKTMLKTVGITSRYALVKTKYAGPFFKKVPSMQFDHALLYIPSQKTLKTDGFFIDPTAGFDSFLGLGKALIGVEAMVIDEEATAFEFRKIDENIPGTAEFILRDSGVSSAVFSGTSASDIRFRLAKKEDAESCLKSFLIDIKEKNSVTGAVVKDGKYEDPLVLEYSYEGGFPGIVTSIYNGAFNGLKRHYPFVLPYYSERFTYVLKSDKKAEFSENNRFFSYSVKDMSDGTIKVDFVIKKWKINSEEFAELEKCVINVMMFERQMKE